MSNYEESLKLTDEAIDKLVDVFKQNISHLEILREHINDMNEEQFNDFKVPFATVMLPTMSKDAMMSGSPILATIETIKYIKGKNNE